MDFSKYRQKLDLNCFCCCCPVSVYLGFIAVVFIYMKGTMLSYQHVYSSDARNAWEAEAKSQELGPNPFLSGMSLAT